MGLLGSIGAAAGELANKYIDQDIQMKRDTAISQNALNNAMVLADRNQQFDIDKENRALDPERLKTMRDAKIADLDAVSNQNIAMTNNPDYLKGQELESVAKGKNAALMNTENNTARADASDAKTQAQMGMLEWKLEHGGSGGSGGNGDASKMIESQLKRITSLETQLQNETDPSVKESLRKDITEANQVARQLTLSGAGLQAVDTPKGYKPNVSKMNEIDAQHGISKVEARYGNIPKGLMTALVAQESHGDPNAKSETGVVGLGQVTLPVMEKYGYMNGNADRRDPQKSLDAASHYMSDLIKEFKGNVPAAVVAYNSGGDPNDPDMLNNTFKNVRPQGQDYVKKVMANYNALSKGEKQPIEISVAQADKINELVAAGKMTPEERKATEYAVRAGIDLPHAILNSHGATAYINPDTEEPDAGKVLMADGSVKEDPSITLARELKNKPVAAAQDNTPDYGLTDAQKQLAGFSEANVKELNNYPAAVQKMVVNSADPKQTFADYKAAEPAYKKKLAQTLEDFAPEQQHDFLLLAENEQRNIVMNDNVTLANYRTKINAMKSTGADKSKGEIIRNRLLGRSAFAREVGL